MKKVRLLVARRHPNNSTISKSKITNIRRMIKKWIENLECSLPTTLNPLSNAVSLFLLFTLYLIRNLIRYKSEARIKLRISIEITTTHS